MVKFRFQVRLWYIFAKIFIKKKKSLSFVRIRKSKWKVKLKGEKLSAEQSEDLLGELDAEECGFVSLDKLCEVLLGRVSMLDVDV